MGRQPLFSIMAIRIRKVDGVTIALCAAETDPKPGDIYLDDAAHYALMAKFCQDHKTGTQFPLEWEKMETQKVRDAETELKRWLSQKTT